MPGTSVTASQSASGRTGTGTGVRPPATVPDGLEFFERLRTWMAAFPPAGPDRDYQMTS